MPREKSYKQSHRDIFSPLSVYRYSHPSQCVTGVGVFYGVHKGRPTKTGQRVGRTRRAKKVCVCVCVCVCWGGGVGEGTLFQDEAGYLQWSNVGFTLGYFRRWGQAAG